MTNIQAGIDAAPDTDLRRILKAACKESKAVEHILAEHLLVSESVFDSDVSSGSENNAPKNKVRKKKVESGLAGRTAKGGAKIPPAHNKRVKLRFVKCDQCEEQFDVMKNNNKACHWHPGELEEDEDPDMYYDSGYKRWMRVDGGEGYCWNWTCCGLREDLDDTDAGGCSIGPHVQVEEGFRRRTRLPSAHEIQRKEMVIIEDDSGSDTPMSGILIPRRSNRTRKNGQRTIVGRAAFGIG